MSNRLNWCFCQDDTCDGWNLFVAAHKDTYGDDVKIEPFDIWLGRVLKGIAEADAAAIEQAPPFDAEKGLARLKQWMAEEFPASEGGAR